MKGLKRRTIGPMDIAKSRLKMTRDTNPRITHQSHNGTLCRTSAISCATVNVLIPFALSFLPLSLFLSLKRCRAEILEDEFSGLYRILADTRSELLQQRLLSETG